jgi:hypothetical protein
MVPLPHTHSYFPAGEETIEGPFASPGTRKAVRKKAGEGDPVAALLAVGFREEHVFRTFELPEVSGLYMVVRRLLQGTAPRLPEGGGVVGGEGQGQGKGRPPFFSHTDLRRLNLDSVAWLIQALGPLDPQEESSWEAARAVLELLCRIDALHRHGEGSISRGMRGRLQRALVAAAGGGAEAGAAARLRVDSILRFLGSMDLPAEVDLEIALSDHLTGLVLVDPVTLGECAMQ